MDETLTHHMATISIYIDIDLDSIRARLHLLPSVRNRDDGVQNRDLFEINVLS